MTNHSGSFKNTMARLAIGSLDDTGISVEAHYNPKELGAQLPVGWPTRTRRSPGSTCEYDGSQPRTMSLEMLFDSYEQDENATVQDQLDTLERLASPRDPDATTADLLRPHYCVVTWGAKGMHATALRDHVAGYEGDDVRDRWHAAPRVATVKVQEVTFQHGDDVHEAGFTTQVNAAALAPASDVRSGVSSASRCRRRRSRAVLPVSTTSERASGSGSPTATSATARRPMRWRSVPTSCSGCRRATSRRSKKTIRSASCAR